jgi:spore germination protein
LANTITNRQMIFILFVTLTSASIVDIPKVMAESAGSGSWTTLLLTAAIVGVLAAVIVRLNHAFSGMILYDYSRELMGRAVAIFFAICYISLSY